MKFMRCFVIELFILVSFTFYPVMAQNTDGDDSRAFDLENSLLWKIEGNDIETSYLYGTLHLLPLKDFIITDKVLTAFELADQIVLELDMDDPAFQTEILQEVKRKDNATLYNTLSEEDYKKLDQLLVSSYGAGVQYFNSWHPAMVGTFLIKNYIEGESASFEVSFVEMADEKNKEIFGLETPEEQLAIFDEIPYEEQIDGLKRMIRNEEQVKKSYDNLISLYKQEKIDPLYNFVVEYYGNPETVEKLLKQRNKKWIPKFKSFSSNSATFYAVGAGHLSGKYGIINLLRKEGYKVSPVFNRE